MAEPSAFLVVSFTLVVIFVGLAIASVAWVCGRRSAAPRNVVTRRVALLLGTTTIYLAVSGLLAARGLVTFDGRPPRAAILIAGITLITVLLAMTRAGSIAAQAPLALLVGIQAFRLPLELVMHRAAAEGVMPPQMSYSGLNFDIVTGASAILVAASLPFAGRLRLPLVRYWNVLGSVLLAVIITIGWLSAPTPLRMFHQEPANVWITRIPFVWLPLFLVQVALFGHLVTFRALAGKR